MTPSPLRRLDPVCLAIAMVFLPATALADMDPPGCSPSAIGAGIVDVQQTVIENPQIPTTITLEGLSISNFPYTNACNKTNLEIRLCCPDATGNPVAGCNINLMNQTFPDACGPGCSVLATPVDPQPAHGCDGNSIIAPATSLNCGDQPCTVQLNPGVDSASARLSAIGVNHAGVVNSPSTVAVDLPFVLVATQTPPRSSTATPTSTPTPTASVAVTVTPFDTPPPGAVAQLNAGVAVGFQGSTACLPVSLSSNGQPIATTVSNVGFAEPVFSLQSNWTLNPAITNKHLSRDSLGAGLERFTVSGDTNLLPDGLLYTLSFKIDASTVPGKYPVSNASAAYDPEGNLVSNLQANPGEIRVTTCPGDCNGDGVVTIGEVTRCANLFQGQPLCDMADPSVGCPAADIDGNGNVSIGEMILCAKAQTDGCPAAQAAACAVLHGGEACNTPGTQTPTSIPGLATQTSTPTETQTPTPIPTPPPCAGDCQDEGSVTVPDLVTMVNIALGTSPVSSCLDGDANGDGQITIEEILGAVTNALSGCP